MMANVINSSSNKNNASVRQIALSVACYHREILKDITEVHQIQAFSTNQVTVFYCGFSFSALPEVSMNRYDELMKRLLAVCEAQPEIKAVIIVGSQAGEISKADEYSDLDLIVACYELQILIYENNIIGKLGKPVYSFVEDTFAGEKERRILFEKSLDVDMIVMSEDSLVNLLKSHNADFILNRGFSLCYDACGISQLICKSSKITPCDFTALSEESFSNLTNDFMFHTVWAEKKIRRGELWTAIMCVDGYLKTKLITVIEMYEHCIHGTAYDTWHNGRMAEQWAEPFIVDKLGDCFSRYDAADLLSALTATRELFLTLAKECASAYGYTTGIPEIDS